MTREDIIKLAREVGYPLAEYETGPYVPPLLETLLKHVVAAEREACAKVCIEQADDWRAQLDRNYVDACSDCAAAIRARKD